MTPRSPSTPELVWSSLFKDRQSKRLWQGQTLYGSTSVRTIQKKYVKSDFIFSYLRSTFSCLRTTKALPLPRTMARRRRNTPTTATMAVRFQARALEPTEDVIERRWACDSRGVELLWSLQGRLITRPATVPSSAALLPLRVRRSLGLRPCLHPIQLAHDHPRIPFEAGGATSRWVRIYTRNRYRVANTQFIHMI